LKKGKPVSYEKFALEVYQLLFLVTIKILFINSVILVWVVDVQRSEETCAHHDLLSIWDVLNLYKILLPLF